MEARRLGPEAIDSLEKILSLLGFPQLLAEGQRNNMPSCAAPRANRWVRVAEGVYLCDMSFLAVIPDKESKPSRLNDSLEH